jgi:hypothetical protein
MQKTTTPIINTIAGTCTRLANDLVGVTVIDGEGKESTDDAETVAEAVTECIQDSSVAPSSSIKQTHRSGSR